MLQPSDLGAGHWQRINGERFSGDPWIFSDLCPAYRTDDYPALRHQLAARTAAFTDDGAVYPDSTRTVGEDVARYEPGWGARSLDDVREVLSRCGTASPSPGVAPSVYRLVATNLAGDESLLIRVESFYYDGETIASRPLIGYQAVVRVGDLVATVTWSADDPDYVRGLAQRAAARLR